MEDTDIERQLEALLSEEEPYIDDAGFTRNMLDRLPPARRRSRPDWLKPVVLITSTVLASGLAVAFLPDSSILADRISQLSRIGVMGFALIVTATMLGLTALSLVIARSEI